MYNLKQVPRLNLEELHTFIVVAQLRSFSAAAEFLHRTTSAISHRIKMLEDSMGVQLVERSTRSFNLTASGEMLLEKASQIFELQRSIPEELQQIQDGIEPHFAFAINNLLYNAPAIAVLLAHLHNRFPRTAFKIQKSVYMGVWDAMQYGYSQFAIGVPGFHPISDVFQTEPLGVIRWVMVASPDHPVTRQSAPVTLDVLQMYPVINIEDTSLQMQKRQPWRLAGQQELIVPDMETKIDCHIQGLGIGFLPARLADAAISRGTLVQVPLAAACRSPSPLALAWRTGSTGKIGMYLRELLVARDPLVEALLDIVSSAEESDGAQ